MSVKKKHLSKSCKVEDLDQSKYLKDKYFSTKLYVVGSLKNG